MSLNIELSKNSDNILFSTAEISGIHFKIFSSPKGVSHIFINKKNAKIEASNLTNLRPDDPLMFNVFNELTEYFNSQRKEFRYTIRFARQ